MRLLVINPNTSAEMTAAIMAAASAAAGPEVAVDAASPANGPASIEGRFDEIVSAYWTLDAALPVAHQYDGLIVACYGPHPVIDALREALPQPVVGIMEASLLYSTPLGNRFSIVTTSLRWQPLLEEGVRVLGLERRCASVRSLGLTVLETVALPREAIIARLVAESRAAVEQDGAEVICLGCAGLAGLERAVAEAAGVPVVDGVRAAVALVRGLVDTGARTSKRNLYRQLDPQPAVGLSTGIARAYRCWEPAAAGPLHLAAPLPPTSGS